MKDCTLTVRVNSGKVTTIAENITIEELATLSGYIQAFAGMEAVKRGMGIEDVKNNMLDIHLAAMQVVNRFIVEEVSNGSKEET